MAYLPAAGLTEDQRTALHVEPEYLASLPPQDRLSLAIRAEELDLAKSDSFWNAIEGIATVLLPLAVSVGLVQFVTGKSRK